MDDKAKALYAQWRSYGGAASDKDSVISVKSQEKLDEYKAILAENPSWIRDEYERLGDESEPRIISTRLARLLPAKSIFACNLQASGMSRYAAARHVGYKNEFSYALIGSSARLFTLIVREFHRYKLPNMYGKRTITYFGVDQCLEVLASIASGKFKGNCNEKSARVKACELWLMTNKELIKNYRGIINEGGTVSAVDSDSTEFDDDLPVSLHGRL